MELVRWILKHGMRKQGKATITYIDTMQHDLGLEREEMKASTTNIDTMQQDMGLEREKMITTIQKHLEDYCDSKNVIKKENITGNCSFKSLLTQVSL